MAAPPCTERWYMGDTRCEEGAIRETFERSDVTAKTNPNEILHSEHGKMIDDLLGSIDIFIHDRFSTKREDPQTGRTDI
jgi:hypothetical protein